MKLFIFIFSILLVQTSYALTNSVAAVEPEFQSVVFIHAEDRDGNEDVTAYCNGTLLAPNLIITAAHCVKGSAALKDFNVTVEVGAYRFVTRKDGTVVRVGYAAFLRKIVKSQFFFTKSVAARIASQGLNVRLGPTEDIAVILLGAPLELPADFPFQKVVSNAELAGIGSNVLRYTPTVVSINPFEEVASTDTKKKAQLNSLTRSGSWESKSTSRLQGGDSGGPLFVKLGSEWRLIGIVKGRADSLFSSWDVFGVLDQKICEISSQVPDRAVQGLLCRP